MRCLSSTSFRVSRTAPPQCRAALPRRIDDLIKYRSQFPTCCQSQHGHWPNAAGISSSSFFCNTVSCRAWISHPLYRFALHKPFFFFFFFFGSPLPFSLFILILLSQSRAASALLEVASTCALSFVSTGRLCLLVFCRGIADREGYPRIRSSFPSVGSLDSVFPVAFSRKSNLWSR